MKRELKLALGSHAARLLIEGLLGSCRIRDTGLESFHALRAQGQPVIFALWHGRLLAAAYRFRGHGFVPLISRSGDGEYISRIVERWGYEPVRGSSSRGGGEALRDLVRYAHEGRNIVLTPDGPRGPFQELKHGVITAAHQTGCPIIPVGAGASRGWFFGKWDRFLVPKPFSRISIVFGEPIRLPRTEDPDVFEAQRMQVTAAINAALARADDLARAS